MTECDFCLARVIGIDISSDPKYLFYYKRDFILIFATYLRNVYVAIIQTIYHSDCTMLIYKETTEFTGTTLVCDSLL